MMSTPEQHAADVIVLRPTSTPSDLTSVQGALALDLTPRVAPPRVRPRLAHAGDLVPSSTEDRRHLDTIIARYLSAVVEIAAGTRPVTQVLRHSTPEVYADLTVRAQRVAAVSAGARQSGSNPTRPVIVSVRTARIREDAAEASAHVRYGRRSRAVAARFELIQDRWQCVAITLG